MTVKARPILFSSPMIRAILEGRKTVTRRVIRGVNGLGDDLDWRNMTIHGLDRVFFEDGWAVFEYQTGIADTGQVRYPCPYGKPGDRLWVQETWGFTAGWPFGFQDQHVKGGGPWLTGDMAYRADNPDGNWCWRSSTCMPRWASRITLEVTEVRVERLHEITEEDAIAEGMNVRLLAEITAKQASRIDPPNPHWIHGLDDDARTYCRPCALKRVKHLRASEPDSPAELDGGFMCEEDRPIFCESCERMLDYTLTDYGVDCELEWMFADGITQSPADAYRLHRALGAGGNPYLTESCGDFPYRPELKGKIAQLCFRTLWHELNGKAYPWASNPWVWKIAFRRIKP